MKSARGLTRRRRQTTVRGMKAIPGALRAALALIAAGAVSCSVSQSVLVRADGSGTASLRVQMSRLLLDYLLNLAELSGQQAAGAKAKVFDLGEIRKGLEARPGLTVSRLVSPAPDSLEVDIACRSFKDLFESESAQGGARILSLTESAGTQTLAIHLDKRTFRQLSALFPVLSDPAIASLGPQENQSVSEKDYLSMLEFALGADAPALVKKSVVEITIQPEGQIVSQTGETLSGASVVFRVPLLALLILDKPLDFTVSYR